MQLRPGLVLARRYRVRRRVGAGGMAEVWEGEHLAVGLRVALKQLLPHVSAVPELAARFRREAELLCRVRSDHVARVLDFLDEAPWGPVLVMEFVEGEPLSAVVRARRLEIEEAIDLGVDVLRAVRELHAARIIHRDLKPGNVLLERIVGGRRRARLVDLGMARRSGPASVQDEPISEITQSDVALGTMEYMAPEQITSARKVGFAADVYAIGAILFRAVSGRHVFDELRGVELARAKLLGEAPSMAVGREDELALRFAALVQAMLRRTPGERPASASAALTELLALRAIARSRTHPATAVGDTPTRRTQTACTRIERTRYRAPVAVDAHESRHVHRVCLSGAAALALALLTGGAAVGTAVSARSAVACVQPPVASPIVPPAAAASAAPAVAEPTHTERPAAEPAGIERDLTPERREACATRASKEAAATRSSSERPISKETRASPPQPAAPSPSPPQAELWFDFPGHL